MFERRFSSRARTIDPMSDAFRAHFEKQFGRPAKVRTMARDADSPTIDIGTFRAPWDRRVLIFTSIGLSQYAKLNGDPAEVALIVDTAYREALEVFRRIVSLMADEPAAFGLGETYAGPRSMGSIASRHGKTVLALTSMNVGDLQHVDGPNGSGHVFLLVPISDGEQQFLANKGLGALEQLLSDVDPSHLARPSVA